MKQSISKFLIDLKTEADNLGLKYFVPSMSMDEEMDLFLEFFWKDKKVTIDFFENEFGANVAFMTFIEKDEIVKSDYFVIKKDLLTKIVEFIFEKKST